MKKIFSPIIILGFLVLGFGFCSSDEPETARVNDQKPAANQAEQPAPQQQEIAQNAESYAIAVAVNGEVKFTDDKRKPIAQWVNVRPRQRLHQGDVIKTGNNGKCTIKVGEDNNFVIDANSSVTLESLLVDGGVLTQSSFSLDMGKLLAKPNNVKGGFTVRTPSVVAGVRGTEFLVEHNEGRSVIAVKDGIVRAQRNIELDIPESSAPEIRNIGEIINRHYDLTASQRIEVNVTDNQNLQRTVSKVLETQQNGGTIDTSVIPQINESASVKIQPVTEAEQSSFEELATNLPEMQATVTEPETEETVTEAAPQPEPRREARRQPARKAEKRAVKRRVRQPRVQQPAVERNPIDVQGYDVSAEALGNNYRSWRANQQDTRVIHPEDRKGVTVNSQAANESERVDRSLENKQVLPVEIESAQAADIEELEKLGQ